MCMHISPVAEEDSGGVRRVVPPDNIRNNNVIVKLLIVLLIRIAILINSFHNFRRNYGNRPCTPLWILRVVG